MLVQKKIVLNTTFISQIRDQSFIYQSLKTRYRVRGMTKKMRKEMPSFLESSYKDNSNCFASFVKNQTFAFGNFLLPYGVEYKSCLL